MKEALPFAGANKIPTRRALASAMKTLLPFGWFSFLKMYLVFPCFICFLKFCCKVRVVFRQVFTITEATRGHYRSNLRTVGKNAVNPSFFISYLAPDFSCTTIRLSEITDK